MSRPTGTPGTFAYGCGSFAAVRDHDGRYHWRGNNSGRWYEASTSLARIIAARFVEDDVPEWVTRCTHEHGPDGSMTCDTEAQCDALAMEELRLGR